MGGSLFTVLIAAIKSKIMPIVTRVRRWLSWSYVRTHLIAKIREFFVSLFDVRPRHKDDYYGIFGWLVSKRLAIAIVVAVGVISLYYLFSAGNVLPFGRTAGMKTYSYKSILLRFTSGTVRIKGKDGYLAYEGQVKDGGVNGLGTLYNKKGVVVYQGEFSKNKYQGTGVRYYNNGTIRYNGKFAQNKFEGEGKLYRENGSLEYEGEFSLGRKEGQGKLYDSSSNAVYTGGFSHDELLYSDFLGKKATEVAEAYEGKRLLYENGEDYAVVMEDIDAMYLGRDSEETLDDERSVGEVIVLKNSFPTNGKPCRTIAQLRKYLGQEVYNGNSGITVAEAIAVNWLSDQGRGPGWTVDMDVSSSYEDYALINSWDDSRIVYLYSFRKDGLLYTFVCEDKEDGFLFYTIEKEEGGEETE